ncbi:MAG: sigma-70 family RNA polymerase sigma factor [Phycisphaerae bacterium]|jgi:RNA polymerase sigma-70 factor (ECF subfamily)
MVTATSTSLLLALKDQDNDGVWRVFCERYQPLLLAFARKLGLSEHEAEDAAQETLLAFAKSYEEGGFDPEKGRLRKWLLGIAAHKIRDIQRRRGREFVPEEATDKTGLLRAVPDDHTMSEIWQAEWERGVLRACLEEVRRHVEPSTLQAFELFVLQEWPAERVAAHLGISPNAVFKAKRRVLSRMREAYQYLQENW